MFDIGFWELLVIAVVLLLVMGPERLPEVARQAAFLVRKARQSMYRLRNEMQGEMDGTPFVDLRAAQQEMRDFKNDMRQFGSELADSAQNNGKDVNPAQGAAVRGVPSQSTPKPDAVKAASPRVEALNTAPPVSPQVAGKATSKVTKKVAKKAVKKAVKKVAKKSSKKVSKRSAATPKTGT